MPKAIVCDCEESTFSGDITVSTGSIIHPRVTIIAKSGPIIIGENCLIEEYVTIRHDTGIESDAALEKPPVLVIGANNVFEVGCTVEALKIGEKNTFECKCFVSSAVKVSNNCVIGAGCKLVGEQELPENTIIHGKNCEHREALEKSAVYTLNLLAIILILWFCYWTLYWPCFYFYKFYVSVAYTAVGLFAEGSAQLSSLTETLVRSEEN